MTEKVDLMQGAKGIDSGTKIEDSEEMREVKMILQWGAEATAARAPQFNMWDELMNAYKGKTWKGKAWVSSQPKTAGGREAPELNIIRSTIQSILPILTDAEPGFTPIPRKPESHEFAEMLGDYIETNWTNQSMPIKIVEVLTDQEIFNIGIMKVTWDRELEDGQGDLKYESKDPKNILTPKGASDFDRDCKYVIEKIQKPVGEWRAIFPKKAHLIKADKTGSDPKDKPMGGLGDGTLQLVSPVDRDRNKTNRSESLPTDQLEMAEGWECWYTDDAVEEHELEDQDGKKTGEKVKKKKFPNGHLTTILPNQKVLLQSVRNPYEGPQSNCYVRFVDTILPRCIYGEGQAEPLLQINKMLNKTVQGVMEYIKLMSNAVWILDKTSGVNKNKLTNRHGLIVTKEPGTEVRRDMAAPLNDTPFKMIELLKQFGDITSGVQDVTQGRKPKGVTAAEAIAQLEEAAQTRIRLKERNLNNSLAQMARMSINRILQFVRANRFQRLSGDGVKPPDFIEFNIEEVPPGEEMLPIKQINRRKVVWEVDDGTGKGQYVKQDVESAQSTQTVFDVEVATGSSMPLQKINRTNIAFKLRNNGDLSRKDLLETLDFPKAEQVLQNVEEEQLKVAQQQAALQPQPGV